jgi:Mesyanzhinovviridae Dda-like helicase
MIQLASQQQAAFDDMIRWYRTEGGPQVYYLGGWAGTGKSTVVLPVVEELVGLENVVTATYTGKAAYVLRTKGMSEANTMHSFMYHSRDNSRAQLQEYEKDLQVLREELKAEGYSERGISDHPGVSRLEGLIFEEEKNSRRPCFVKNPDSIIKEMPLSVLDEVSMVNDQMKQDWCSYGRKVLVLGDPFQLPPVGGEGAFTKTKPNFMLTEIHRQAANSPVIKLASQLRNMEMPAFGRYGASRILRKGELSKEAMQDIIMESDQIIVGKNETRHSWNNRMRMLKGFKERFPMAGETIVCLRNNHQLGLLNGALYTVLEQMEVFDNIERIDLLIQSVDGGSPLEVHCHTHHFLGKEDMLKKMWFEKKDAEEFDFGYALTCHKVQGSQFKRPVIWDESWIARADCWKWRYTAATRAEDSFTLFV